MIISVLTARKGSKRIKNKNIRLFNNKPIISYPIKQIIKSKIFRRNFISTDSKKIEKISKKLGIESLILRDKRLSDDNTGVIKVVKNFIQILNKKKIFHKYVCCVFPTAVFFRSLDLKKALKILKKNESIEYVFSAHQIDKSFLRSFKIERKLNIKQMNFPNNYYKRSQDLEKIYVDSGQFYFAKASTFLKEKKVFTKRSKIIDLSSSKVIDINSLEDWKKSEKLLK